MPRSQHAGICGGTSNGAAVCGVDAGAKLSGRRYITAVSSPRPRLKPTSAPKRPIPARRRGRTRPVFRSRTTGAEASTFDKWHFRHRLKIAGKPGAAVVG